MQAYAKIWFRSYSGKIQREKRLFYEGLDKIEILCIIIMGALSSSKYSQKTRISIFNTICMLRINHNAMWRTLICPVN